mmetsp:Transcript_29731/g.39540  ORF Transcript_29731/g.39540 Transcript_29731/m.39540 type:complete len:137 (+) Transcript_29731:7287-7697(+)
MAINNAFLGRGWSFPPTFEKSREEVNMVSEEQDIHESIEIILSTKLGERVMNPKFGCNLDDLLFSSIDLSLITYVSSLIETSILLYEPRIDLNKVNIDTSNELEGYVNIEVDYTIRSVNSRRNLVYPFYRGEGTDV